ncbi:hypothetical protein FQN50_006205 [Emmonsiellopsis sp. PD_5]|nr:hypothetical protein FQN50_006205 [Emmonsiellopsis sp. PD_5]
MGAIWRKDKESFIESWLEDVTTATGRSDRLQNPEEGPSHFDPLHHSQQQQNPQTPKPGHSHAESLDPRFSKMPTGGKRPAKPPTVQQPPPSKKQKAAPKSKAKSRPSQPESVQLSQQMEHAHTSSYATSAPHPSSRYLRQDLEVATPAVIFAAVDGTREKPQGVVELITTVLDSMDKAIPGPLRLRLLGTPTDEGVTPEMEALWTQVEQILSEANRQLEESGDEGDWTCVIRSVLNAALDTKQSLFTVKNIQTTLISPTSLIPVLQNKPFAVKKIDMSISLSGARRDLRNLYLSIRKRHSGLNLSQIEDPKTHHSVQFAGIEVKSPDGSYYDASIQLAIWLAAGLQKLTYLRELADSVVSPSSVPVGIGAPADRATDVPSDSMGRLPPYLGIAIVGHSWYVHMGSKEADGTVIIYGPLLIGDTTNRWGIIRLLAALRAIQNWGETVWFPWITEHILQPLASHDPSPLDEEVAAGSSSAVPDVGGAATGEGHGESSGSVAKGKQPA